MTEEFFAQQVKYAAYALDRLLGVPMGVSDKHLLRKLAKENVSRLEGRMSPRKAVLNGVTLARGEFPKLYR